MLHLRWHMLIKPQMADVTLQVADVTPQMADAALQMADVN